MILSIGEILADMIGEQENGTPVFKTFCGGAPFNVAVNAKQAGGKVGFIGKVGKDPIGKFLIDYAFRANLDYLDVAADENRKTTLAFVTLTDGERDFAFFRGNTADYALSIEEVDLSKYEGLSIVHLGSLMFSEKEGRDFADALIRKVDEQGVLLSLDVNFRMDLYESFDEAKAAYKNYIDRADILKFSEDEILAYTGKNTLDEAIAAVAKKDRLLLVTLGSKGSMYAMNGETGIIPTQKVTPVDTTGAGDAFYGCFLANIDGKTLTKANILLAMEKANEAGGRATLFKGAVQI